jgi:hypothetical protein
VDSDPNPDVFGPPVSGYRSGSFILLSPSRNSKKNLDSYCFVTSFDGNDGNVTSKSYNQKFFLNKFFVGILKVNDENIRIRIRIRIH